MSKHKKRKQQRLIQLRLESTDQHVAATSPPSGKTRIHAIGYGPEKFFESDLEQPEDIRPLIGKWPVLWVHVAGVSEPQIIHKIGDIFLLHELALEDVMNICQRAKVEPYGDTLFVVMRAISLLNGGPSSEQVCLFLGNGFIVSFEEKPDPEIAGLTPIRERIRRGSGHLRTEQADYLLYAIVDSIIDGFFPIVEATGDALQTVEDEIVGSSNRLTPARIHQLKRDIINVRRAIWPGRDAVNSLTRDDISDLLSTRTRVYMRDCYDHAMRLIDLVETQREECSDLMDLYLSSVSNRMNEIMKVLTIVTLLFMPPTLVAGIYGMNFQNMPELKWPHGYLYAIGIMLVSSALMGLWARKRGWLNDDTSFR
jgi:magnesium transporter